MTAVGYITLRFPISVEVDGGTFENPPEQYLYAGEAEVIEHSIPTDMIGWFDHELREGEVFCDFSPTQIAERIRSDADNG